MFKNDFLRARLYIITYSWKHYFFHFRYQIIDLLNSLSSRLILKFNQNSTDESQEIVDETKPVMKSNKVNYIYKNFYNIRNKMKFFLSYYK